MRSPFSRPDTCRLPNVTLPPSLPRRSAAKAGPIQSNPVQPLGWRHPVATTSPLPPAAMDGLCGKAQPQHSAQPDAPIPTTARAFHPPFVISPGLNSQPQSNPVQPSPTIGVATACCHNSPLAGHPNLNEDPRHPIRHWSFVIRPASHVATMSSRALAPPSPNLCFICAARPTFGSVANSKFPPKLSMIFHAQ